MEFKLSHSPTPHSCLTIENLILLKREGVIIIGQMAIVSFFFHGHGKKKKKQLNINETAKKKR